MERPTSLTVIAWLLIVGGGISMLSLFYGFIPDIQDSWAQMGANPSMVLTLSVLGGGVQIVSGYAMLERIAWGRLLYALYAPLALLASWLVYDEMMGAMLLPAVVMSGVILYFLFRPAVTDYFEGRYRKHEDDVALAALRDAQKSPSDVRRVLGVLSLMIGGFMTFTSVMVLGFAEEASMALGTLVIFGTTSAMFIVGGVFLWGPRRWAACTGWVFAIVGGLCALYGIMMRFLTQSSYWDLVAAGMDAEVRAVYEDLVVGAMVTGGAIGSCVGMLGILLLLLQRYTDSEALNPKT